MSQEAIDIYTHAFYSQRDRYPTPNEVIDALNFDCARRATIKTALDSVHKQIAKGKRNSRYFQKCHPARKKSGIQTIRSGQLERIRNTLQYLYDHHDEQRPC